jgi:hypothetical protein
MRNNVAHGRRRFGERDIFLIHKPRQGRHRNVPPLNRVMNYGRLDVEASIIWLRSCASFMICRPGRILSHLLTPHPVNGVGHLERLRTPRMKTPDR